MNLKSKHSSRFGFYTLFAHLFYVANKNRIKAKVCISGDVSEIRKNFELLKFSTEGIVESDLIDPSFYVDIIRQLESLEVIYPSKRRMTSCCCGKIFVPEDAELYSLKKSLICEGLSKCCNSSFSSKEYEVLQTEDLFFLPEVDTSEHFAYDKQIKGMKEPFKGKSIVVTRPNKTSLVYRSITGINYFIDNDLLNYLTPRVFNEDVKYILGGRNLIKHTVFYDFYNHRLSQKPFKFILLPKVSLNPEITIEELVIKFGYQKVVERLLHVSQSKRNDITINIKSFLNYK